MQAYRVHTHLPKCYKTIRHVLAELVIFLNKVLFLKIFSSSVKMPTEKHACSQ